MDPTPRYVRLFRWMFGMDDELRGLTRDEFEEYEMLGECMEWRPLRSDEQGRFDELHAKRRA